MHLLGACVGLLQGSGDGSDLLPNPPQPFAKAGKLGLHRAQHLPDLGRPLLDRDIFSRGQPEPIAHIKRPEWTATLYDLLSAYASQRQKHALSHLHYAKRTVWSLAEAREVLERLIGRSADWARLDEYLITYVVDPALAATVIASSFASALELVREGYAEIHQHDAFAPIYMRKRVAGASPDIAGAMAPGVDRRE